MIGSQKEITSYPSPEVKCLEGRFVLAQAQKKLVVWCQPLSQKISFLEILSTFTIGLYLALVELGRSQTLGRNRGLAQWSVSCACIFKVLAM